MSARMGGRDEDFGALLGRLHAAVVGRERPILSRHGLSMWEYVVLSGLRGGAVSQMALARITRRDPTRLGVQVNELGARGLLTRESDESDRRRNLVTLTSHGRMLLDAVEVDIRAMEAEVLSPLPPDAQRRLRDLLAAATDGIRSDAPLHPAES